MNCDLPFSIYADGEEYLIRKKGDYRVILDVIAALNDEELTDRQKLECAFIIFFEDYEDVKNQEVAIEEMMKFINGGEVDDDISSATQIIEWEKDFSIMVSPINKCLGYDIRTPKKYTHWWTFLSGYMEIGESLFSTVIAIRKKKSKGQKLEKWEQEFYNSNRKMVDLPIKLTPEEQALLDSDW